MSDTPRTDAAEYESQDEPIAKLGAVDADFARQLERELNAANDHIKRLDAVVNDPHALWTNWLRGDVKLPEGIGDVRQYQERIKRLEEALDLVRPRFFWVHHSKKHQHKKGEPCPVVALTENDKEVKP